MKHRYVVFGSPGYDQSGGWDDFLGGFDSLGAAMEHAKEFRGPLKFDAHHIGNWAQVIDLETFEEILPDDQLMFDAIGNVGAYLHNLGVDNITRNRVVREMVKLARDAVQCQGEGE